LTSVLNCAPLKIAWFFFMIFAILEPDRFLQEIATCFNAEFGGMDQSTSNGPTDSTPPPACHRDMLGA